MSSGEIAGGTPLTYYLFEKAARERVPLSGTFELTPMCNFSCRMCYVRKTAAEVRASVRPMMRLEEWLGIAEWAKEAGALYLLLTGGEPLCWPDFWPLYERLVEMGFLVSVNTNGSLIDGGALERLKKLPPRRMNITLYGASDETYERLCRARGVFSRVRDTILSLKAAGIPVRLNGSLTPYNVCDLEQMVSFAKENGLYLEATPYMFPPLRRDETMVGQNDRFTPKDAAYWRLKTIRLQQGEENYRNYLKSICEHMEVPFGLQEGCEDSMDGTIKCRAGRAAFWVTWDGWLMPCGMMTRPKVELAGCAFPDAWRELTEVTSKICLSGLCENCPNRMVCHSCAAMAQAETGSLTGVPLYLCRMAEAMRRMAMEELARPDI